jgi:hypothetical protein
MIEAAKQKLLKYSLIASIVFNVGFVAEHGVAYLVTHSGRIHADVQVDGWSIGGGTKEAVAREQQLAALEAAMPVNAMTATPTNYRQDVPGLPKIGVPDSPLPQRKPAR